MCALLRELIIPVGELRRIAIECGRCKAVTVLDLGARIEREGGPVTPVVASCCACGNRFDDGIRDRIRALASILEWMSRLPEQTITFRVPPAE